MRFIFLILNLRELNSNHRNDIFHSIHPKQDLDLFHYAVRQQVIFIRS